MVLGNREPRILGGGGIITSDDMLDNPMDVHKNYAPDLDSEALDSIYKYLKYSAHQEMST